MRWKQIGNNPTRTRLGIASTSFATIYQVVGLTGLVDDLSGWKKLFDMIPEPLSWFLLGVGLTLLYLHAEYSWGSKVRQWLWNRWVWILCTLRRLVPVRYMYVDKTNKSETPWRTINVRIGEPKIIGPSLVWDSTHEIKLVVEAPLGYRISFKSEHQPQQAIVPDGGWSTQTGVRCEIPLSQMPKGNYRVLASVFEWDYKMDVFDNRDDDSNFTVPR